MDLQTRKYRFIKQLFKVQEVSVLNKLEEIINEQEERPDTLEEYNHQLDEANARVDSGQFFTQEEVEKMAQKW